MADAINILSLFSGTGMLDVAVGCELGRRGYAHRVLGYIERDACAAALLLAGMEAACLGEAPVWCDDLAGLDARPFAGRVDILTASPPCQPYSLAGKRRGNADERAYGGDAKRPKGVIGKRRWAIMRRNARIGAEAPLWHLARIIGECGPALVFLENVPAWVMGGHFRRFGEELCRLGYALEDPIFLASEDLAAPHRRERVFILAYTERARSEGPRHAGQARDAGAADAGGELADGERAGHAARTQESDERPARGQQPSRWRDADGCDSAVADTERARLHGAAAGGADGADGTAAGRAGEELPLVPPGRNDFRAWAAVAGLDPTLMPAVESPVPGVADALAPVADSLRLGGNGVDPLVAAVAFGALCERAGIFQPIGASP